MGESEPEPEPYRESEDGKPTIPLDRPGFGPPAKEPEPDELSAESADMLRAPPEQEEGVELGM
jgi:hypothetical protein